MIDYGKCGECSSEACPGKVKPLAQYLAEYLQYENKYPLLEQALEAYQSTENVTIKIERKT